MIRLASIIDTFESAFLAHYRERLRPEHTHALAEMKHCRTQVSAKMQLACTQCEHQTLVPHSYGHRHCPHCQHHESQQWLERQLKKQVPAEYFLITFTLPAQFRALAWAHQRILYDLLLRCAWETVRTFSQNDRQLRGAPGAIAVLHTNTREHAFHPHVHLVMPAAALDAECRRWRTKAGHLFNHKALAKVFRAKMLAGIQAASLHLPERYPQHWVLDCKSVGTGKPALIYLGRYLYRGVIREDDILACDNGQGRYRFRNAKTGQFEQRTAPGAHFLWLILQHVLPKGFRRARNFGFLHPNCKRLIVLLQVVLKFDPGRATAWFQPRAPILCACCGALMTIVRTQIRSTDSTRITTPIPTQGTR
jgi:Putative transposase/Transposase zinc-binding domain